MALDPLWLGQIGALMSESLYLIIIPLVMLLALWCLERQTFWRFGVLGLAIALGVLTRSEAIDFVVLLGVPLLLMIRGSWKSHFVLGGRCSLELHCCSAPGWFATSSKWVAPSFRLRRAASARVILLVGIRSGEPCLRKFLRWLCDRRGDPPRTSNHLTGRRVGRSCSWTAQPQNQRSSCTESSRGSSSSRLGSEVSAWGLGNQNFQLQLSRGGRPQPDLRTSRESYLLGTRPVCHHRGHHPARRSPRRFVVVVVPIAVAVLTVALTYGSTRLEW